MTSIAIIIVFAALIAWILVNGSRHWNNVDERRKRIIELGGSLGGGARTAVTEYTNEEATERHTREISGADAR